MRCTLGLSYLAVRASTFRSVLRTLRLANAALVAYQNDNTRLATQNKDLRVRLSKELDLDVASPGFRSGLAGRTAVGTYRNENVGTFIQHMNEVGSHALVEGEDAADFYLRNVVKPDLEALFAAPPATEEEGQRRALCEHTLTDERSRKALAGTEPWNERSRQDYISDVLSAGVDTSVFEIFRRSPELARKTSVHVGEDD